MTFLTVIKNTTFENGTVEVDYTGNFVGNLTGNVNAGDLVEANVVCVGLELQSDVIREKTMGNGIIIIDPVTMSQTLMVDTITDTDSASGITIEDVLILNGMATADTIETDELFAKTSPGSGTILVKDDLNLWCKNLSNVEVLTANTIQAKSGSLSFDANICIPADKTLQTDTIQSKTPNGTLTIQDDVVIEAGETLSTDTLNATTGAGTITIGDDVSLDTGETLSVDTTNVDTVNARTGTTVTFQDDVVVQAGETLSTDVLMAATGNGTIAVSDNVAFDTGNSLSVDTTNVDTVNARTGTTITFQDDVVVADDETLSVNTIDATSGTTITILDDVDMFCKNLSNVEVLTANTLQSKSGSFNLDANVCIPVDKQLQTDTITSKTTNGNVTIQDDVIIEAGETLSTDTLNATTGAGTITIGDDVALDTGETLSVDTTNVDTVNARTGTTITFQDDVVVADDETLSVNTIDATSGTTITILDDVDMFCKNLSNVEVLTANTLQSKSGSFNLDANVCIPVDKQLQTDTITSKTTNGTLTIQDDVVVEAGETLSTDTINATTGAGTITIGDDVALDTGETLSVDTTNVDTVNARTGTTITFQDDVVVSDDETLSVNTIDATSGTTITILDDVDMFCGDLSNVEVFSANTIQAKQGSTQIAVGDDMLFDTGETLSVDTINVDTINARNATEITVGEDLIPSTTLTYDLGSSTNKWKSLYVQDIFASGDATINGDLNVLGNLTTISTTDLIIEDNKIVLNSPPQAIDRDAGLCIARYQNEGDTGTSTGDVVQDTPFESGNVLAVGTTTTLQISNTVSGGDEYYTGWFVRILDGPNAGEVRQVTSFDSGTDVITVDSAFTNAMSTDDVYSLYPCKNIFIHWDESANKIVFSCTANVAADIQSNITPIVDASGNRLDLMPLCVGDVDAWNVVPLQDSLYDLGTTSKRWNNVYTDDITVTNTVTADSVCATTNVQTNDIVPKSGTDITFGGNIIVSSFSGQAGVPVTVDNAGRIILGNVESTTSNIVCATLRVETPRIQAKTGGTEVAFGDNIVIDTGNSLVTDITETDTINARTVGGAITVGDDMTLDTGNAFTADTVNVDTLNARTPSGAITVSDDLCIDSANALQVNTIEPKTGDFVTTTGNLVIAGLSGNNGSPVSVDASGQLVLTSSETLSSNVVCALVRVETPQIKSKDGSPLTLDEDVTITSGNTFTTDTTNTDTINARTTSGAITIGNDLCIDSANSLQVNTIEPKTGDFVTTTGNLVIAGLAGNNGSPVSVDASGQLVLTSSETLSSNVVCALVRVETPQIKSKDGTPLVLDEDVTVTSGNTFTSDTVNVDTLDSRNGLGITINDDVVINSANELSADTLSSTTANGTVSVTDDLTIASDETLSVNTINDTSGGTITIQSNVDAWCKNLSNVENFTVDTMIPKNGQTISVNGNLAVNGDLTFTGDALNAAVFRVDKTTGDTQAITSNVATKLTFDSIDANNVNIPGTWDGTDTFTINRSAWYQISASYRFDANFSNKFQIQVYIDGVIDEKAAQSQLYSTGVNAYTHVNYTVFLNQNATVEIYALQTEGTSQTVQEGYFSVYLLPGTNNAIVANVEGADLVSANTLCATVEVQTDTINAKTASGTITIGDDVSLAASQALTSDILNTDTLNAKTPSGTITIGDDVTLSASQALTADTLNVDTINARTAGGDIILSDDVCIDSSNTLQVNTISPKTGDVVTTTGNLTISGLAGNAGSPVSVDANGQLVLESSETLSSNVVCALLRVETPRINSKDGSAIAIGDDMEFDTGNTLTVDTVLTNTIQDRSGNVITIQNEIDAFCQTIGNVESIIVSNISSKGLDIGTQSNVVAFQDPALVRFTTTGGGVNNQFWGYDNGLKITSGTNNTSMGSNALVNITTSSNNVVLGRNAGSGITTTNNNVAIGFNAGYDKSLIDVVCIGSKTLSYGTTASPAGGGVFIGKYSVSYAGLYNSFGSFNVAVGYRAMRYGTSGTTNVAIGNQAWGGKNTGAGFGGGGTNNKSGSLNIAIGNSAGDYMDGSNNIALGSDSMSGLTSTGNVQGSFNIAFGEKAMRGISSYLGNPSHNFAAGRYSLGSTAMYGSHNTTIGYRSGVGIAQGNENVFLGYRSGDAIINGNSNICIGKNSDGSANENNQIAIGVGAITTTEDEVAIGRPAATVGLSANATATVWGQTFQNRTWDDGQLGFAKIDGNGNIIKDNELDIAGNLDLNCGIISNVMAMQVSSIEPKEGETSQTLTAADVTVSGNLTVNGKTTIRNIGYFRRVIGNATTYVVQQDDVIISANTLASAINLELPVIADLDCNMMKISIVDEGGNSSVNNITITAGTGDNIMGGTSVVLSGDYNSLTLYADETDTWYPL